MRYTLVLLSPRIAALGLAGVYVYLDHPWIALFPLGAAACGMFWPKVGA